MEVYIMTEKQRAIDYINGLLKEDKGNYYQEFRFMIALIDRLPQPYIQPELF